MSSLYGESLIQTVVVSHDIHSNALGRALSMGLVARELGNAKVVAFGAGPIWPGAVQFDFDVIRLGRDWKSVLDRLLKDFNGLTVVWFSKGISPLPAAARHLQTNHPGSVLLLDLDDDDAGLASSFFSATFSNKLRLIRRTAMLPISIRSAQKAVSKLCSGFTFSSFALSEIYPSQYRPAARIPHVRTEGKPFILGGEDIDLDANSRINVGIFGTLRPHKGGSLILEAIRSNPDLHLYTFENCGLETRRDDDMNWTEIAASTPLDLAYSKVDVAVIPIISQHQSAQLQFPAKLVDAMKAGVAIVASGTPPIREYAGVAFIELPISASSAELADLIREASHSDLGSEAQLKYRSSLSPAIVANELLKMIVKVKDEAHEPK
ncbi:hypothetical protein BJD99_00275 [Rhodococcus sp. 1163]|uniref:glycosyltransferase family 1 protein n=1 Tax=Rhodococcus sp. 1163 TaxID=1905289 RepID=UPI0009FBE91C|nr:glycosyltransferase family 1 protein [Rhodococcus sp. 1163]ORI19571.1 hypothetical protein BJD99_00275 [Rhodococcus sp. 1163]